MTPRSIRIDAPKRITFKYAGKPEDVVSLWGSFNDWQEAYKEFKTKKDGEFSCICVLKPGRYEYKFQVNGAWVLDAENPNFVQNNFGSLNNVMEI